MIEVIKLMFPGEPKAIQSVRFARVGNFTRKYQPKDNIDWKTYVKTMALQQLPEGWKILDCPIAIDVEFLFSPPKSTTKRKLQSIIAGNHVFKTTKPDLTDNLMKGVIDALTGLIWRDDALICRVHSVKRYAMSPAIIMQVMIPENRFY